MTIKTGDMFPDVTLKVLGDNGMEDMNTKAFLSGKKVVLFAVPGAFTPSCSQKHMPGYVAKYDEIRAQGIDAIVCLSVNDPFVMKQWATVSGALGKITMWPDGNATLVEALGLTLDASGFGLGKRAQRFSMIIDNGKVTDLQVEPVAGEVELSGADACLARIAA